MMQLLNSELPLDRQGDPKVLFRAGAWQVIAPTMSGTLAGAVGSG